jgi:hypothetical protein
VRKCQQCGSECGPENEFCSKRCEELLDRSQHLQKLMIVTQPSEDHRIFFYPLTFGRLVDEYVTMTLKQVSTRSIRYKQELDYILFKCNKSIETHISQIAYDRRHRASFSKLVCDLFGIAGEIWRLNELARDPRASESMKRDLAYSILSLNDQRHQKIKELDVLLTGRTTHVRVYSGEDF